jgi:hypothetical protein
MKAMKQLIKSLLFTGAMLTSFSIVPQAILAASFSPYTYIAAAQGCDLPNGTQGSVSSDGKTCCPNGVTDANDPNWATNCFFAKYITPAIQLLSAAVGALVVISIMYGGFETITAGPDVSKAAAGRKRIIQALIGLFAYMSLFALMQFLIPGGVV